jgi:flagellum-specific ATP synthase
MGASSESVLAPHLKKLDSIEPWRRRGEVCDVAGLVVRSKGPLAAVGDLCEITLGHGRRILSQVVGFQDNLVLSMPLDDPDGLVAGNPITVRSEKNSVGVSKGQLGRVLDGFGRPIDGLGPVPHETTYPLVAAPPNPMERKHITELLPTGLRVIDGLLPCGKGQRVGIFGGSGVGKSVLLGSLARHNCADVTVVALIGERNREVREFLDHDLGEEGLKKSVVVVATSDRPAPLRVRAVFTATAIAEYFRDQGADVLLIMDSVTRLAMAQREIGLAAGEPPSQKGYTPSVFNLLPKVFERAGNFRQGSITGMFTVLVEGDDFNEPISDAVRSILDGHIMLSRKLGDMGHYPAIDVLHSVSRLTSKVADADQQEAIRVLREAIAVYRQSEDLINLGAYVSGTNTKLDASIRLLGEIEQFLRQESSRKVPVEETIRMMRRLRDSLRSAPGSEHRSAANV